jgi:alkylation response protein AidB-like acyl-CoA dehydrogenase
MDVTIAQAPAAYDDFRGQVREFIAAHAPKAKEKKAGMRTPETRAEVDELQQWTKALSDAGFNPMLLAEAEDTWPHDVAAEELDNAGVPYKIGNPLVEKAIMLHGTDEQKARFLPRMRSGEDLWCQLFSEPNAGSDLASMQTRAELDGDVYRINGQKVWTTWGQWSDYGYLLARSEPEAGKHAGITAFVIDMHQPGVDVRPLREITGTSDFNEVFFTDAVVPVSNRIGGAGEGWRISTASLASERSHQGGSDRALTSQVLDLVKLAGESAKTHDDLVRLYERAHILRLLEFRADSKAQRGTSEAGDAPILKVTFSSLNLDVAEESLRLLGTESLLEGRDPRTVDGGRWQDMFLYARAYTISAGSNEIMRNVISERALGMPREKQS